MSQMWELSHRADRIVRPLADRHYNRQHVGSPQFVPPGRCMVLKRLEEGVCTAFWVTSFPYAEYTKHAWAGALICSAFRNEGKALSSELIVSALSATRWKYPDLPELGMITFVNPRKVRSKKDPGYCFLKAGFRKVGMTKGGLVSFQMSSEYFPDGQPPFGVPRLGFW